MEITMYLDTVLECYRGEYTVKKLLHSFHNEIYLQKEAEELGELHWYSLVVGWALAQGLTVDEAQDFATIWEHYDFYQEEQ